MPLQQEAPKTGSSSNTGRSTPGGTSSATPTRSEFDALTNRQKDDTKFLINLMAAVVIVVVITVLMEISSMHRNYAQDKSLALQNNQLNKDYFDKMLSLNNEVRELKSELRLLELKFENHLGY